MFLFHVNTAVSMLIATSTRLLGEDTIILDALFVDHVYSLVSVCSFPTSIFIFVVSLDGIRK